MVVNYQSKCPNLDDCIVVVLENIPTHRKYTLKYLRCDKISYQEPILN